MVMKFLPRLPLYIYYNKRRLKIPEIDETAAFFMALRVPCESKSSVILLVFCGLEVRRWTCAWKVAGSCLNSAMWISTYIEWFVSH